MVDSALRVLQTRGWERRDRPGPHHEIVLAHPDVPGLPIELHRAFATWSTRVSRLSARALWDGRQRQTVGGVPRGTLCARGRRGMAKGTR